MKSHWGGKGPTGVCLFLFAPKHWSRSRSRSHRKTDKKQVRPKSAEDERNGGTRRLRYEDVLHEDAGEVKGDGLRKSGT